MQAQEETSLTALRRKFSSKNYFEVSKYKIERVK